MRTLARFVLPLAMLAAGVVVLASPVGCGKSASPPTTVRGRVTFQGQPVAGGLVVFAPDGDRGTTGRPARAETGPDGSFELRLGPSNEIPPGWYRVALAAAPGNAAYAAFPPELARPDRSGLVREVKPGQEHVFEFGVEVVQ